VCLCVSVCMCMCVRHGVLTMDRAADGTRRDKQVCVSV